MTPQLSPESLEPIRALIEVTVRNGLSELEGRLEPRFDAIDRHFVELRGEMRDGLAENRRHFGVLAEALQTKLELVIEGQMGLGQRVDRRFGEVDERIDNLDRRMVRMSARLPARRKR